MTLPVAESPHKISVRKTDEAVSVFDGSAISKLSFRAIGHAEYCVCSGKRPLVDVEDTSTSHLSSPTACCLVCEMGQLWKNGRNRNACQALLSSLSLDYERWSLSPWGRCLHQAKVTARKSLWLMQQPGLHERRMLPAGSRKGTRGHTEIALCLSVQETFLSVQG